MGGDKVGRDKIMIQNLVYVGRFLDLANAEDLLSITPVSSQEIQEISADLESYIDQHLQGDLASALAKVGNLLKDFLSDLVNENQSAPAPSVYTIFGERVFKKLAVIFQEGGYYREYGDSSSKTIWFETLNGLWKKKFKKSVRWGICTSTYREYRIIKKLPDGSYSDENYFKDLDFKREEYRVFLVGLILDLTRIFSEDFGDKAFWDGLVNLLDMNISKPGG
jgi:hypothetical protein